MSAPTRPPKLVAPLRFYRSAPRPCAYLPGLMEQLIFAELDDASAMESYDTLTHAGFRRSHNIIYRPACANCAACIPVRIVAHDFEPDKSLLRIRRRNRDTIVVLAEARATIEQFHVFQRYQRIRHPGGDMAEMTFAQYRAMIEETAVSTFVSEFRKSSGELIGAMLADQLGDGVSAVYSFFDPAHESASPGTFMILWLIDEARRRNLPYVYLGYWIEESPKMSYKTRFRPIEALGGKGWARI
ncbi:MAG: arginyltransferase [Alphaproteobacteria bacterium]|nr:arginyltransferase [Alphaproteobacteria bacterium]